MTLTDKREGEHQKVVIWGDLQGKTDVRTGYRLVKKFLKNRLTLLKDDPQCKNIGLTLT